MAFWIFLLACGNIMLAVGIIWLARAIRELAHRIVALEQRERFAARYRGGFDDE